MSPPSEFWTMQLMVVLTCSPAFACMVTKRPTQQPSQATWQAIGIAAWTVYAVVKIDLLPLAALPIAGVVAVAGYVWKRFAS